VPKHFANKQEFQLTFVYSFLFQSTDLSETNERCPE